MRSLFILNDSGEVLIEKHWKGMVPRALAEAFWSEVLKYPSRDEVNPIIPYQKFFLLHVLHRSLFFLAIVQGETMPLFEFEFLHRTIEIFTTYFEEVSEESIKENFTTVYQLLDEMMDNGIPLYTELNHLQGLIRSRGYFGGVLEKLPNALVTTDQLKGMGLSTLAEKLPDSTGSTVPWRSAGVKYSSNEIYVDLVEEIDAIFDNNQMLVSSEVMGVIEVNCRLSGMPDLSLSFNNPRILDDTSFHPCVRHARWESNKVISFIPPDGQFQLLSYKVPSTTQIQMPIYCKAQLSYGNNDTTGKLSLMVGPKQQGFSSGAGNAKNTEKIIVTVPFPRSVTNAHFEPSFGAHTYDDATKVLRWEIGKLPPNASPILNGSISCASGSTLGEKPTVLVDFTAMMYSASGLKVDSLVIHNERNYKPWKGVRTITRAGKFQIRC